MASDFTTLAKYVFNFHLFSINLNFDSKIFIIQHIDTLPKYGHKTLDVRGSTSRISNDGCKFGILKGSENDRCL